MPDRTPASSQFIPLVLRGKDFQWVMDLDDGGNLLFRCLDGSGKITNKVRFNRDGSQDSSGAVTGGVSL